MKQYSNEGVILYNYFRSSASFRVRIALNLKKINYKYQSINLLKGEQKSEDYMNKNPQQLVPALEIDNIVLFESLPIIEYLDETRPNKELPLYGKNPFERS